MNQLMDAAQAIKAKRSADDLDIIGARNSDGCSMVPDFNFRECCVQHDMDYMNPNMSRLRADNRMRKCIKSKTPWWNPISLVYFAGVQALGSSRHVAFQEYTYESIEDDLWS